MLIHYFKHLLFCSSGAKPAAGAVSSADAKLRPKSEDVSKFDPRLGVGGGTAGGYPPGVGAPMGGVPGSASRPLGQQLEAKSTPALAGQW